MNNRRNILWGLIFIVVGVLLFANTINLFRFSWYMIGFVLSRGWPLVLLVIGISMHMSFFSGKSGEPGILVPAGILTTYGGLFLLNSVVSWRLMTVFWPVFILGVAVGLFELYLFGGREKGLLIPVGILGGLSAIFMSWSIGNFISLRLGGFIVPAVIVLIGIVILVRGVSNNRNNF